MSAKPFSLELAKEGKLARMLSLVRGPLEKLFWLEDLNRLYARASGVGSKREFLQAILRTLGVCARVSQIDLACIPAAGPCLVIANHPFGAIEGIILANLLEALRPDVKILANHLLHRIPELRDLFIFVDPFGGPDAARSNLRGLRQAIGWLDRGGMLALFPAGTVSHLDIKRRAVTDPIWSDNVARIVRRTEAPVLPVYFQGANSPLFQFAGLLHPKLRTAMLPRELFKRGRATINIRVGRPIAFNKLNSIENDREMTEHLRRRTYLLRYRDSAPSMISPANAQPVDPPMDASLLAREIAALPADCTLIENGDHLVLAAHAQQMPRSLREIGRLREITFRQTGEGTGNSIDLDKFDHHYLHLFVWNRARREIVSAYRLGFIDKILAEHGPSGLYTRTLFHFKPAMLENLAAAIELGRSFVRAEHQRGFSPLMLLWKGIGQIMLRRPKYRALFGPVSISNTYTPMSRQLIAGFLRRHHFLPDLARLVRARHPFHLKNDCSLAAEDMNELSELVSELQSDNKGIPILIKQYLKLGGAVLGFNLDANFNNVVDALVYVDLAKTDRRVLEKYAGRQAATDFLRRHVILH